MKYLALILFCIVFLEASNISYKGNIGVEYEKIDYKYPLAKDKTNKGLNGKLELEDNFDSYRGFIALEFLEDSSNDNRDYTKVNEFYIEGEYANYLIKLGRDVRFWGALELHNISDIYNIKNDKYQFDKDKKVGTDGISMSYYFDNEDELTLIYAKKDDISNQFIKYSATRDILDGLDLSFIYNKNSDAKSYLTYNTLLNNDTLYKLEYSHSEINNKKYYQNGVGIEHTLYGIRNGKDLGVLVEYYKSDDVTKTYQDDMFLGSRITFNDVDSSDILVGVIQDRDDKKKSYSFEYNTRFLDSVKTTVKYMKNDNLKVTTLYLNYHF
jgi:hypothetical protein